MWEEVPEFYEDEDHCIFTDQWCARQRERALANFDLNTAYFGSLDHAAFDAGAKCIGYADLAFSGRIHLWTISTSISPRST